MSSMNKSDLLKNVGKRVQDLRLSKGLTQVDLVGKIDGDIDTTNISRLEAGRTNPTLYTLYRISQALEVELSDLLKTPTDL
jgi:transcriptional regulator with XRE-family HTH domain